MQLEKQKVLEELDRIAVSEEFRNKPVLKRMLTYVVTETLEGRSELIKAYSIGVDVFGQGGSFDPNSNALVRNNAVRLRALLKAYYLGEGQRNPLVIDIPKGRYVPAFSSNGRYDDAVAGGGVGPGVAAGDESGDRPPSVAILPFTNHTNDGATSYLATGFSQTLADAMTKFEMRVVGVGSFATDDSSRAGLIEEARAMGINFLIEGEVASIGGKAKVSVRLIDAKDRSQLWVDSVKLDLEKNDLFEIQERIAGRVSSLIGGEYGYINRHRYKLMLDSRPQSPGEQQALLKQYHVAATLTEDSLREYHQFILDALEREPDSALIHACAAANYGNFWTFAMRDADDALSQFSYHAEKAYELDPGNQWVLSTLGFKCFVFDEVDRFYTIFDSHKDWMANSPLRLGHWAMNICYLGDWELGLNLLDQVYEQNLEVPSWLRAPYCIYHYMNRDYDKALIEANKIRLPGLFWGPALRVASLGQLGRVDEAEQEFALLLEYRPDFESVGRRLVGCYVKDSDLFDHVFEGFAKVEKHIA